MIALFMHAFLTTKQTTKKGEMGHTDDTEARLKSLEAKGDREPDASEPKEGNRFGRIVSAQSNRSSTTEVSSQERKKKVRKTLSSLQV